MVTWNLLDIVEAVDGELFNPPKNKITVSGVYHDTRKIKVGSLFVPIIAQRDGHDFVEDAVKAGASVSFWSKDTTNAPSNIPLILVKDTEKALQQFSKWYLNKVKPKVIGITGSNGKTTTKDMIEAVLSTKYKTHKTAGNFNNHLGVPLTILEMPINTEMLVLEMGMSTPGEIKFLSELAKPDVAAVTMIGESHIEAFGSREKLAEEKVSIITYLKENGLFVYPENEQLIKGMLPPSVHTRTFGQSEYADIFASDIVEKAEATSFIVQQNNQESLAFKIPIPGSYNVQNALLALLIGLEFEVSLKDAQKGLARLELTQDRLEWLDGKNGVRILNDAYNASPTSVKAVLDYFSNIKTKKNKIIVLGDILELGDLSQELHESLASAISLEKYKAVYLYGEEMNYLYKKLISVKGHEKVRYFTGDKSPMIESIQAVSSADDLILFKSSNGTDLLSVVDVFKK